LPGYFGGNALEDYAINEPGDTVHVCHDRGASFLEDARPTDELKEGHMCIGHMLAQLNDLKQPRDPALLAIVSKHHNNPARKEVFRFPSLRNFIEHHSK